MNIGDCRLTAPYFTGQGSFQVSNLSSALATLPGVPSLITVYRHYGQNAQSQTTYPITGIGGNVISVGTAVIGSDQAFLLKDEVLLTLSPLSTTALDLIFGATVGSNLQRTPTGWAIAPSVRVAKIALAGVAATTGGGIATWQPAEAVPVMILRCLVNVTVVSTGAANLSVGMGSSATTSYTNLITASDVHTATTLLDSLTLQAAATAAQALLMPAADYVTFTGSATTAGLVGAAYIEYLLV